MRVVITMPVYEDWESAALMCQAIDAELANVAAIQVSLILVDDGSTTKVSNNFAVADYEHLGAIRLLRYGAIWGISVRLLWPSRLFSRMCHVTR